MDLRLSRTSFKNQKRIFLRIHLGLVKLFLPPFDIRRGVCEDYLQQFRSALIACMHGRVTKRKRLHHLSLSETEMPDSIPFLSTIKGRRRVRRRKIASRACFCQEVFQGEGRTKRLFLDVERRNRKWDVCSLWATEPLSILC